MDDLPPSSEAHAPSLAPASVPPSHGHGGGHGDDGHGGHDHGHEHHELGFWRTYVFSTDHKTIGIQYLIGGFSYLFFGFGLMLLMRWQIAFPGEALTWDNASLHMMYQVHQFMYHLGILDQAPLIPVPIAPDPNHPPLLQYIFGPDQMPGGKMTGDFYNTLGAMHGTIMVFFGIVPVAFAAFGNYVMPLQIGTVDMAFPRLNMGSVILFFFSAFVVTISFFVPGGAAKGGWTSYTPLATIGDQPINTVFWGHNFHHMWPMWLTGQSLWLIGMVFNITSSLLSSVNFITTIVQLRTRGHGLDADALSSCGHNSSPPSCFSLPFPRWRRPSVCSSWIDWPDSSLFSPGGLIVIGGTPVAWHRRRHAVCSGSTCSGSSAIRKFTSSFSPALGIIAEDRGQQFP